VEVYGLTTLPEIAKPHVDKMLEILEWNREATRKLKKSSRNLIADSMIKS